MFTGAIGYNIAGNPYPPLDADAEWLGADASGFVYTDFFSSTGAMNTSAIAPSPNWISTPAVDSFSKIGSARGVGPIRRFKFRQQTSPAQADCKAFSGQQCVVAYSGQQTVTLEIISAWLSLTATPDSVVEGDPVTFTATSSVGGITVREWQWVPDSAGTAVTSAASCGMATTCTVRVYESGTMHVRARVGNGSSAITERATAHVTALPPNYPIVQCPTGDSLLDLPATRALLKDLAWRNDSLTPRVEWSGMVYQLPNGSYRFLVDTVSPALVPSPCRQSDYTIATPSGWTRMLRAHSHPGAVGDTICSGSQIVLPGWLGGVLSPADWELADDMYSHQKPAIPQVAVDPVEIAIGRTGEWLSTTSVAPGTTLPNRKVPDAAQFVQQYNSFPRQGTSCARP